MPRGRRTEHATETDDSGSPVRAPQAPTKPEGVSDQEWSIGGALGNLSLATALLDVTGGKRAPRDDRETAALMDAARKLEARSYKRYRTLRDGMGRKIEDARAENLKYADMLDSLRCIEDNGTDSLTSQNGRSPLSHIVNEPIDGEVSGTVGTHESWDTEVLDKDMVSHGQPA